MIAMFDISCPNGWTRFSALDDRVPRGSSTYGTTGGGQHTHSVTTKKYTEYLSDTNWSSSNAVVGINSADSWPPYINVIWCKKS